jgi:hypothetical protein
VKSPSTILSTAELISTVTSGALLASFFGGGSPTVEDGLTSLIGAIAKENRDDLGVFKEYLETVAKPRRGGLWPAFYKAGRETLS